MTVACSALSASLGEPLDGTAPAESGVLVVERPGPWDRVAEADLPELVEAAAQAGLRLQIVRRTKGRYRPDPPAAWVGSFVEGARFLERVPLDGVLELDLAGVAAGRLTGAGIPETEPLWLVCTHGTRDPCCAKLGLPLYRAIRSVAGTPRTWHSSHLGGHRFAPTLAVLPAGAWLGRVPAARASAVLELLRAGRLPLDLVRGMAGRPPAAQAAELAVRRELALDAVDGASVEALDGDRFAVSIADRTVEVSVSSEPAGERPLSCGAGAKTEDPGRWVVELDG